MDIQTTLIGISHLSPDFNQQTIKDCVIAITGRCVLIKLPDGRIYSSHYVDMASSSENMPKVRRAYARLAGIKLTDLNKAIRLKKEASAKERQEDKVEAAKKFLQNSGYVVTKGKGK